MSVHRGQARMEAQVVDLVAHTVEEDIHGDTLLQLAGRKIVQWWRLVFPPRFTP